ncbi:MAG: ABC transporter ATP-binding protein, partial [Longimicrobiales bacterium]
MASENSKKKRVSFWDVRREAWALISAHKRWLMMGFGLMVIGQLAGLVMPFSSKFVIDTVLGEGRGDLLIPVALLATLATLVQAGTSFGLSQVVSITAQRAIRDLRAG